MKDGFEHGECIQDPQLKMPSRLVEIWVWKLGKRLDLEAINLEGIGM